MPRIEVVCFGSEMSRFEEKLLKTSETLLLDKAVQSNEFAFCAKSIWDDVCLVSELIRMILGSFRNNFKGYIGDDGDGV